MSENNLKRVCRGCGDSFTPKRPWQEFCTTPSCKNKYWYRKYKDKKQEPKPQISKEGSLANKLIMTKSVGINKIFIGKN